MAKITNLKLTKLAESERDYLATWNMNYKHVENYTVQFQYYAETSRRVKNSKGQYYNVWDWIDGSTTTVTHKQATYSVPEGAAKVRVRVKPKSTKTKVVKKKKTYWWTGVYSGYVSAYVYDYYAPEPPATPTITVDDNIITVSCDNLNTGTSSNYQDVDAVRFCFAKNNSSTFTRTVTAVNGKASYTFTASSGCTYRVKAAAQNVVERTVTEYVTKTVVRKGKRVKQKVAVKKKKKFYYWSEYSAYSADVETRPLAPTNLKVSVKSMNSVLLSWTESKTAKSYEIHYATNKEELEKESGSSYRTASTSDKVSSYILSDLTAGSIWYFRIRAKGTGDVVSAYTDIISVALGSKPEAPTTWSSASVAYIGEKVNLYWVHNTKDGSDQIKANIEATINGRVVLNVEKNNTKDEYGEYSTETSVYELDTSPYSDSSDLLWRIRTMGVTNEWGEWSIQRSIKIYEKPSLIINVLSEEDGVETDVIDKFPIYLRLSTTPSTQIPIGYSISIISTESYSGTDETGAIKRVNIGDEVYTKYIDGNGTSDNLSLALLPSDIDIQNGITYKVTGIANFDSGLTATSPSTGNNPETFIVALEDETYNIDASITYNSEDLTAYISPYCTYLEPAGLEFLVDHNGNYLCDKDKNFLIGIFNPDDNLEDNTEEVDADLIEYADGVTLSVYRRESNGKLVKIATGISNDGSVITDPHPTLDYARYRIVAISDATGAISYDDVSEIIGETSIVIQWDEQWLDFDGYDQDDVTPSWSGSMVKLPYNIDVTESNSLDVSLVEYAGRERPVSYYGTQLKESPTWTCEIPKEDEETIYQLRRLSVYPGDVYVREPSGTGYWAQISVSLNIKHNSLTVPVTLSIKPVEGGM